MKSYAPKRPRTLPRSYPRVAVVRDSDAFPPREVRRFPAETAGRHYILTAGQRATPLERSAEIGAVALVLQLRLCALCRLRGKPNTDRTT